MCKSYFTKRMFLLLLIAVLTCGTIYASDPTGCTTPGVTVTIGAAACSPDNTCASKITLAAGDKVVVGQHIVFQANISFAGGSSCGFSGGTLSITAPDGTVTNTLASGGTLDAGVAIHSMSDTCLGCTAPETGINQDANTYHSPFTPAYTVRSADVVAGFITATTNYVGGLEYAGSGIPNQPTGSASIPLAEVSCSVTVDKQVSCDGKPTSDPTKTWTDVTGGDDTTGGTFGCIAPVGGNVDVRFISTNTSTAGTNLPVTCTLGDNVLTVPAGSTAVSLAGTNGSTSTASINPFACTLTNGQSGVNTATLSSCSCTSPQGTAVSFTGASDTANYACCGVAVDKEVACNGGAKVDNGTSTITSTSCVLNNEDTPPANGIGSCNALTTQNVTYYFSAQNRGNTNAVCNLADNGAIGGPFTVGTAASQIINLPSSTTTCATITGTGVVSTNSQTCTTSTLGTFTDTATLNCTCAATGLGTLTASALDTAQAVCATNPSFFPRKTCTLEAGTTSTFDLDVKAFNTDTSGTTSLVCTVTDVVYAGACGANGVPTGAAICGGTGQPACPVLSAFTPSPIGPSGATCNTTTGANCAVGDSTFLGFSSPTHTCDVATVSCTSGGIAVGSPQTSSADCIPQTSGCFTRTPGYWGTHPSQTSTVLAQAGNCTVNGVPGLLNRGLCITNVGLGNLSAIQDLCVNNNDARPNHTGMNNLQLDRQCMAAELNVAASAFASFNNGTALDCNAATGGGPSGIAATLGTCCSAGAPPAGIGACIDALDAFNNQFENTNLPGLPTSSAQPSTCQVAGGDGFINHSPPGNRIYGAN